jgi:glycerophosphoryl diester phosphodiesterase
MAAFKTALEFGVDGLELDVHLSKDGELMICHDEKVDRTTNGHGFIKDYTQQELWKFDAGSWFDPRFAGEKMPKLSELLELIKGTDLFLGIMP